MFIMITSSALSSVNLPSTVTSIGKQNFSYYDTILINNSDDNKLILLLLIEGDNAFYLCSSLSQILLISGLTVIGKEMFAMNGVSSALIAITIPSTITAIGKFILIA